MDDDVDPRDALLSWGFGACLGRSKSIDPDNLLILGGFVIRRALLTG